MHFHFPKPLHGWREFAGEVGIIVIGVLIALSAEQLVENLHWRGEVRDFSTSVNTEVRYNLAAYEYRVGQSRCAERRLSELERWSADQRAGKATPLLREIAYPLRVMPESATWSSRSADLAAHMPADARRTYSDLYSTMTNVWELEEAERQTWLDLNGFNDSMRLTPDELIQLTRLVYRAKSLNRLILTDSRWLQPDSAALGVNANFGARASSAPAFDAGFCAPIIPDATIKRS